MADYLYDFGLDEWRDWETDTIKVLGLKSTYVPSRAHHYVDDVVAYELTASGYARHTVTGKTRGVDTTNHRIIYDCDDISLGSPAAGNTIGWVAFYKQVTTDSDSILLALFAYPTTATSGSPITATIPADGVHYLDQA